MPEIYKQNHVQKLKATFEIQLEAFTEESAMNIQFTAIDMSIAIYSALHHYLPTVHFAQVEQAVFFYLMDLFTKDTWRDV